MSTGSTNMATIWSEIIDYVDPVLDWVQCEYALVFGTRHGVDPFVADIMRGHRFGEFRKAIVSGGATRGDDTPEAHILADKLVAAGLPSQDIIIEDRATNTLENVVFSRELLAAQGIKPDTLVLIGKICSIRRYMMTVAKQWPEIETMGKRAVNYFDAGRDDWHRDETFRKRVFGELDRIAVYQEKGDITDVGARVRLS